FAFVHQIEALVDVLELQRVGDQVVDVDLAVHVPVDDLRHLRAPLDAAEGGALPDPAGDELERTGSDLLPCAGDADDDRLAPAAMAAFERLAHDVDIADALEAVVGASLGQLDQVRDQVALHVIRIDEVRHAEFLGERLALWVDVDADDHVGADHARALDHVEADAAETEHDDVGTRLDLGGIDDRADARGHAAADIADLVE